MLFGRRTEMISSGKTEPKNEKLRVRVSSSMEPLHTYFSALWNSCGNTIISDFDKHKGVFCLGFFVS